MGRPAATEVHPFCEAIASEWDRLATETRRSPFLRPGWIRAWSDAFGQGELRVHALRAGDELVGVLPAIHHGNRVDSPTNWHTPEFGPVATDETAARRLLEGFLADAPRRVALSFLDARKTPGELERMDTGHLPARRTLLRSPYVELRGDWDSYLAGRSKNLRQSIRRTRRRLEELGTVEFEVSDGGEQLESLLEEGFVLEAKGWKGQRGTAMASRPQTRSFYRDVATWARQAGLLRLARLRLDGRLIAFELSLQDEHSWYLLKPAYEPELSHLNPGKLLTGNTIRHAFAEGLRAYEFLGSDDPYKLRWTDTCHERVAIQFFSPTPAGRLDLIVQTRGRALARRVRGLFERAGTIPAVTEFPPEAAAFLA